MQFIDQQKVAKYWLPLEINFSIQDCAEYPVIFKHCPLTGQSWIIYRPGKKAKKYQLVGIGLSVNHNTKSSQL